jgi:hypothetical protein
LDHLVLHHLVVRSMQGPAALRPEGTAHGPPAAMKHCKGRGCGFVGARAFISASGQPVGRLFLVPPSGSHISPGSPGRRL